MASVTKCIAAKGHVLQPKCANKGTEIAPGTRFYNL